MSTVAFIGIFALAVAAIAVGLLAVLGWVFTALRKNQDAQVGIIDLEDGDF